MTRDRLLLDTVFVQALFNHRDQYHPQAVKLLPKARSAAEVWVTEAVLLEVANALSGIDRSGAVSFVRQCYSTGNIQVVTMTTELLGQGLSLYEARADKEWSLTDCISFVVMEAQGLTDAVTVDHHFRQAGFHALMSDRD